MSEQIRKAANDLLAQIDLYTDCMSNQIDREDLDSHMDALEKALDDAIGTMHFHVQELRPEVLAFALLMEQRLREKDADRGLSWKGMTPEQLFPPFMSKAFDVEKAIFNTHTSPVRSAVDLANYAMMIVDVSGELPALV